MPQEDWDWDRNIIKNNLFTRRVNDVRSSMTRLDALDALNYVNPNEPSIFAQQQQPVVYQELSEEQIDLKAFFDVDTPTYNFRYLLRMIRRELKRSRRYKRPLCVCVLVLDRFMTMFQSYGALAIEAVINNASETIVKSTRTDVDMVGRYSEDRFLIMLPETAPEQAALLAGRIRAQVEALVIMEKWQKVELTCSIGVSNYPAVETIEELIAHADLASEIVVERGGNGVCDNVEELKQ